MNATDTTLEHYEKSVPLYTLAFDDRHSRHLDLFLDRLPPKAEILELGCGTGRDAARMIARGFAVDATDGTRAMLRKAKERYGIEARQMRFLELDALDRYDAVWAHACLVHVSLVDLPELLQRIARALRSGGWHHASFKRGEGESTDDRGRLNSYIEPEWIEALYREVGFNTVERIEWSGTGADGVERQWVSLTLRKL